MGKRVKNDDVEASPIAGQGPGQLARRPTPRAAVKCRARAHAQRRCGHRSHLQSDHPQGDRGFEEAAVVIAQLGCFRVERVVVDQRRPRKSLRYLLSLPGHFEEKDSDIWARVSLLLFLQRADARPARRASVPTTVACDESALFFALAMSSAAVSSDACSAACLSLLARLPGLPRASTFPRRALSSAHFAARAARGLRRFWLPVPMLELT